MSKKLSLPKVWLKSVVKKKDLIERSLELAIRNDVAEVNISQGEISCTIPSGRRMKYEARITSPEVEESEFNDLLEFISSQPSLANEFVNQLSSQKLLEILVGFEASFFKGTKISYECSCPNEDKFCNHVLTSLGSAATIFDTEPFEFLLFKGKSKPKIISEIQKTSLIKFSETVDLDYLVSRTKTEFPEIIKIPADPVQPEPWGNTPPTSSPFSMEGLLKISHEAGQKALDVLNNIESGNN